jgi:hypothetical protein
MADQSLSERLKEIEAMTPTQLQQEHDRITALLDDILSNLSEQDQLAVAKYAIGLGKKHRK